MRRQRSIEEGEEPVKRLRSQRGGQRVGDEAEELVRRMASW